MAPWSVFEFHMVGYRRTWRGSALSSFVLPLLTVLGFGVAVGAHVAGGVQGVPYLDWIVPGLVASTAMQTAIGVSTWPVLSRFEWMKTYSALAASPLRLADIVAGDFLYLLFRVLVSAGAFLIVAAAFGAVHSWWTPAALAVCALVGFAVGGPTTAYSAAVRSDSYLAILLRFAVLPMSLFSGVFFEVGALPAVLRWVAYALPLWHGVELSRAAMLGIAPHWPAAAHLAVLVSWVTAGIALTIRQFHRRLVY
ncbi:ABC transporter permease [Mangrovihabitans endophyticus]|uniref:Transport permease protein n=1 Tax=Mangrovihabitans endophyticus TaxID=1751298 RepID=A0A8J3C7A4_9ACTN|nr:ABC transporter permease [Mangrovihabitans endophyticus]GGL18122.1 transport permease protein [Mangrovihabitans endophyticus]